METGIGTTTPPLTSNIGDSYESSSRPVRLRSCSEGSRPLSEQGGPTDMLLPVEWSINEETIESLIAAHGEEIEKLRDASEILNQWFYPAGLSKRIWLSSSERTDIKETYDKGIRLIEKGLHILGKLKDSCDVGRPESLGRGDSSQKADLYRQLDDLAVDFKQLESQLPNSVEKSRFIRFLESSRFNNVLLACGPGAGIASRILGLSVMFATWVGAAVFLLGIGITLMIDGYEERGGYDKVFIKDRITRLLDAFEGVRKMEIVQHAAYTGSQIAIKNGLHDQTRAMEELQARNAFLEGQVDKLTRRISQELAGIKDRLEGLKQGQEANRTIQEQNFERLFSAIDAQRIA